MTLIVPALAERSTMFASASVPPAPDRAAAILHAARLLLPALERGQAVDAAILRAAMEAAFGTTDAAGTWVWKDAYEASEAAQLLFLRRHGPAMRARAGSPAGMLAMLAKLAALVPTHTRRSEESAALQQFSTPIALGFAASLAAAITPGDLVLEPSAGTGLLAVFAAPDDAEGAVRFRRGWFLGDGTGAGKGRQVAGIILDNWLKGRRRALWVSKSDKLFERSPLIRVVDRVAA